METLRGSLAAAERAARSSTVTRRNDASPRHEQDVKRGAMRSLKGAAPIVAIALLVTNIMTWRALTEERALRVAVEQRSSRTDTASRSMQSNALWTGSQRVIVGAGQSPLLPPALSASARPTANSAPNLSAINARLARKLTDPAAHKALRDQQKGRTLQLYGELLKRWHLSSSAAQRVLDALADYQLDEFARALSGEGGDGASARNAADEDTVRASLNSMQLEELRTYDAALPDRMTLAPFFSELELAETPLPADKAEQLIQAMHDERLAVAPPSVPSAATSDAGYAQALNEWQSGFDERVRDRAALPADLLARFEAFQAGQRAANSLFAPIAETSTATTNDSATNTNR